MFSELIISQAKALCVMIAAGILVGMLWQIKRFIKGRLTHRSMFHKGSKSLLECMFWICSAITISMFMYYSTYGRLTLYSAAGFLIGLILWKKQCCVILKEVWVEKEEAANLKTTVRSSISIRPESRGWKKGRRRKGAKKRK